MEKTSKNHEGLPMVRICATCQKINVPGLEHASLGVDQKVKNEMDVVNKKIIEKSKEFCFSHGACNPHLFQMYQSIPGMTPERLESVKEKLKHNDGIPCLLQNEELRHAYMKGMFTPELMSQSRQSTKQSNEQLTERFKKLAGIKS